MTQQPPPIKEPISEKLTGYVTRAWIRWFENISITISNITVNSDLNDAHRLGDGLDHSEVALNSIHRTSDGSDHTFIDQDVTIASSPSFAGLTVDGKDMIKWAVLQGG